MELVELVKVLTKNFIIKMNYNFVKTLISIIYFSTSFNYLLFVNFNRLHYSTSAHFIQCADVTK